jgi:hypothetical protein
MLKFSKKNNFQRIFFSVKENEASFGIFGNSLFLILSIFIIKISLLCQIIQILYLESNPGPLETSTSS